MNNQLFWILTLNIKKGEQDNFKSLMSDMVASTRANEPDALVYEWFVDDDYTRCEIHENYTDDAAVMKHLSAFGDNFAERFMDILEPVDFVVYGDPGTEVREVLTDLGPTYKTRTAGFIR